MEQALFLTLWFAVAPALLREALFAFLSIHGSRNWRDVEVQSSPVPCEKAATGGLMPLSADASRLTT